MPKQNSTTVAVETTTEPLSNATLLDQIMAETKLAPTKRAIKSLARVYLLLLPRSLKAMTLINSSTNIVSTR